MADNHNLINSLSPSPLEMRQHQSAFTAAATENSSGCGEIVEVQGGHIIRSTGKKDRHSKVCTAKGPRDRRVRLSAPTAIQFYDVQDRLGFDRPSKAVDWLIKKAKSAIDDLAELPPWNPVETFRQHTAAANAKPRKTKTLISPPPPPQNEEVNLPFSVGFEETEHNQIREEDNDDSSFLPVSMDSDSIADTIKSFFPVASTQQPPSQTNTQSQDLRLSLQSFQNGPPFTNQTESVLFSGQNNTPLVFDSSATSWEQNHHQLPEFGKIQRLVTLNNDGGAADSTGNGGGEGFVFASSSPSSFQPVYSQSQLFSQRGPLQSINTPLFRAWCDPHHHQSITSNDLHNHHHHHPYHVHPSIHHSAIPGIAGFRIPSRFHGEQEDHGGNNNNKSSSDSRH